MASGVKAQAQTTTHKATLTWIASSDASANPTLGYNVYRVNVACPTTGQPSGMAKINTTVVTTTTYTDSNLQPGQYCYAVTSVLNGAESADSNFSGGVVLPSAPSGLVVATQ